MRAIDLHAFLPSGFALSIARGIDVKGDVVGEASPPSTGEPAPNFYAFLWRRNVPKPATSQEQTAVRCK